MRLELDALGADGAMSVSFSFRQRRTASEEWCASPPLSVTLGSEDEGLAAVRARFLGAIFAGEGVNNQHGLPWLVSDSEVMGTPSTLRKRIARSL